MLKFYFNGSPNPTKVALFLEESGLPYQPIPVDTRKGEQFKPEFLAINPNGKVPAIDDDGIVVFDSNAILLYLAEKHGLFMPDTKYRGEMLSWLMFIATGIGPYSGQAVHFRHFAPEPKAYAEQRYQYEAERHYAVLDQRLAEREFIVGDRYSFVDMAAWGWCRMAAFVAGDPVWAKLPNLKRFVDAIGQREAAIRAVALKDKHSFKPNFDEEALRSMFRHRYRD